MVDTTHLARIVQAAELAPDDVVLEIGPGLGTLTAALAERAGQVIAVELDNRLIELLRDEFARYPHVTIVHGDILDLDPVALLPASTMQYKVVANLPYYITSAVLRHLLEARRRPVLVIVMVQKEVAERICAAPGNLSLLAIGVQFYAQPQMVADVPAGAFYPRPKVDSAVLRLEIFPEPVVTDVETRYFFQVVRAGFSQKRKQLVNSLSAGLALPKSAVQANLGSVGVDSTRRAETLSLAEWRLVCLALNR